MSALMPPWHGSPEQAGNMPLTVSQIDVGVLLACSESRRSVFTASLAGWSSDNKYSLMGGLRSSAHG
ncbi:MAG: NADH-quinone oxidoreductase subunit H [Chloracidobacterium sp.]|nr:NADH-quinone oxidoreductase subunit H [Chloracidobacterium sp.]